MTGRPSRRAKLTVVTPTTRPDAPAEVAPVTTPGLPEEVVVDGRRVRIEGADEIVLQCGAASITLRRNGRVIIKGLHVESHSAGTNRIKGAVVSVN